MAVDPNLAMQIALALLQYAPDLFELIRQGRAENIDWTSIHAVLRKTLEDEVDAETYPPFVPPEA